MSVQTADELDKFYVSDDPWDYEDNPEDINRKSILLSELDKQNKPKRVLDIGCGHGFVTRDIKADKIVGVDLSVKAITHANKVSKKPNIDYIAADMFDLTPEMFKGQKFDMILITGVLYPQYIGNAKANMAYIIDNLLETNGILVSVHVSSWYAMRFPYVTTTNMSYKYREYDHILEVYKKL